MFSVQLLGGYAEKVVAPARGTHHMPDDLSFEQAAAGQVAFATAWHMLVTQGQVEPGQTVVVQAAGSGIGHAAVQIAALAGARVITTAGSAEKLAYGRKMGASETINYREEPVRERIMEFTDGRGADLYIEHVGGDLFMESLRGAPPGRPPRDLRWSCRRDPADRHHRAVPQRVGGARLPHRYAGGDGADDGPDGRGSLEAAVHAAIPLADAPEAHRIIERREQTGKVILVP